MIGFVPGFHVAWQAHVGGLAIGALVGLIYRADAIGAAAGAADLAAGRGRGRLVALLLVPPLIYG